jgi:arylsulfatase A
MNTMNKAIYFIWAALMLVSCNREPKPNVVIFYADDLGWGDLSVINPDPSYFRHTPSIDEIFNSGIMLSNYMTHCVCSPSRAGLLTGIHYAKVNSGPNTGGTLPIGIPNIARDFKASGYKTGAFGKWHNGKPNFPDGGNGRRVDFDSVKVWNELHRKWTCDLTDGIFDNANGWEWGHGVNAYGFDRWVGYYSGSVDLFDRFNNGVHEINWWQDRNYVPDEKGYTVDLITKHAIDFIEENKEKPFFCYIPQEAVHGPLQIKLTDLKELCEFFPGEWDYVRKIVSPTTGRKIEDVGELRCEPGGEFDFLVIDPGREHYMRLVYATYLYSLDRCVGSVIQKIKDLGLMDNTIFVFTADNGATWEGCNLPFRGRKHMLWEGGVHVPAAIWWPRTFDAHTAPYTPGDNKYEGYIGYLDLYPTLMAMTGQKCNGVNLDGMDSWNYLKNRENGRPGLENAFYWMWSDYGSVRTDRWKLMYSESAGRAELYDLQNDISETTDVSGSNPEVCDAMIGMYKKWVEDNNFAMSYMAVPLKNISHINPEPEGDILEIKAEQPGINQNPYRDGIFVRCVKRGVWGESEGQYIEPGDRLEYDIYVCEDSEITEGISVCPARGSSPFFNTTNGLNQNGESVQKMKLNKGAWTRQVVGVGNLCPVSPGTDYIALQSRDPGYYHFYLDNIVIRRNDGGIRAVIWQSSEDTTDPAILYDDKQYHSISRALSSKKFPLSQLTITTTNHAKL